MEQQVGPHLALAGGPGAGVPAPQPSRNVTWRNQFFHIYHVDDVRALETFHFNLRPGPRPVAR